VIRWALVVTVAVAILAALASSQAGWLHVAAMGIACVVFVPMIAGPARWGRLPRWAVLVLSAGLLLTAAAFPSRESRDVWAYTMYGRVLLVHHRDPYTTDPATFRDDPFLQRMGKHWRHRTSLYGPAFTALSAGVVSVARASPRGNRMGFQLLAALAALGAVLLVGWTTGEALGMAFLGLNPFVVVTLVNGAHNDAIAGAFVLIGVLLAARGRDVSAGVAMGLATLIKVVGIVPMAALALWTWRRRGLTAAVWQLGVGLVIAVAGYAFAGAASVRGLLGAYHLGDPFAVWRLPLHVAQLIQRVDPSVRLAGILSAYRYQGYWAALAMLAVLAIVVLPRLRDRWPALAVGSAVVVYALTAGYVLPWFLFLGLPALALAWRRGATWIAYGDMAVLTFGYLLTERFRTIHIYPAVLWTELATTAMEVALLVVLVVWSMRAATGTPHGSRI
jgi:alpha-1,6-mannosyltransferase